MHHTIVNYLLGPQRVLWTLEDQDRICNPIAEKTDHYHRRDPGQVGTTTALSHGR